MYSLKCQRRNDRDDIKNNDKDTDNVRNILRSSNNLQRTNLKALDFRQFYPLLHKNKYNNFN